MDGSTGGAVPGGTAAHGYYGQGWGGVPPRPPAPVHPPRYAGYPPAQQRMTWVALSPVVVRFRHPVRRRAPYLGPPAYPATPRWGLPRLGWRTPTTVPGTAVRPARSAERVVGQARAAMSVLWMVAISALLAGGGEIWRYALLVAGRGQALPPDPVAICDVLVNTGSALALGLGVIAVVLALRWLLAVREVAAKAAGSSPGRPDWQVLLGVLLPGPNIFVAGSVLAELEHVALRVTHTTRPRPSRLVLAWWAAWAASAVLAVITMAWGLRGGVQAMADGVLWHAATDLAAVALSALTALVIGSISGLVVPSGVKVAKLPRVVTVLGAPEPPLRPTRPAGSTR